MKRIASRVIRTIGFVILSGFSCLAFSNSGCQAPIDADLSSCLYLANSNLNDIYEDLMSVYQPLLDEHEKLALKNDEREWLRNRNKQCKLESSDFSTVDLEKDIEKSKCILTMTNERLAQLHVKKKDKESELTKARDSGNLNYVPPTIPQTGKTVADFAPSGYLIFEKVEADFNGDNLKDVALVLRPTREFDPRPLLILLAQKAGGYLLSARNDTIAPNGLSGGIANPNGADVLKTKGRSLLVQDYGGGSGDISGLIFEFRLLNGSWLLVTTEEWAMNRQGDADEGICDSNVPGKIPAGWKCTKHATQTDFRIGQLIDSWTLDSKTTDQVRIKKTKREIERKELKRFEDVASDE